MDRGENRVRENQESIDIFGLKYNGLDAVAEMADESGDDNEVPDAFLLGNVESNVEDFKKNVIQSTGRDKDNEAFFIKKLKASEKLDSQQIALWRWANVENLDVFLQEASICVHEMKNPLHSFINLIENDN